MTREDVSLSSAGSVWNLLLDSALNPSAAPNTGSALAVTRPDAGTPDAIVATTKAAMSGPDRRIGLPR
jgi:hypothetical protein